MSRLFFWRRERVDLENGFFGIVFVPSCFHRGGPSQGLGPGWRVVGDGQNGFHRGMECGTEQSVMKSGVMELPRGAAVDRVEPTATRLPWHCYVLAMATLCIPIGALWDISWHSSIGRDTFWNPAHIVIYLGGAVPGFVCGWLAIRTTWFGGEEERRGAIRIWRFYAPLGAWITIWGATAMLVSAPFDDWWHNAYGLDVEILSPPHTVLAAGMYAVAIGNLLTILSWQNRLSAVGRPVGGWLFLFTAGVLVAMCSIIVTEKSYPNQQHSATFYLVCSTMYPTYLAAIARASGIRFGATIAASIFMLIVMGMIWTLPLFPAQPMLAPIYIPVERMVPPAFPVLLVFPALAMDLGLMAFRRRRGFWWDCLAAVVAGVAFVLALLAAQWPFSSFMLTEGARNWFFAGDQHWPYFVKPGFFRDKFWGLESDPLTWKVVLACLALAAFKTRLALAVGNWMTRVRR